MKLTTALTIPLLALWASPVAERAPRYGPAVGEPWTTRYELTLTGELDELELVVDGIDLGRLVDDIQFEFESQAHYLVTDEVLARDEERVLRLRRSFDEVTGGIETSTALGASSGFDHDFDLESRLDVTTVLFQWDAKREAYLSEFEDPRSARLLGATPLLDGLDEDMSLRGLLPSEDTLEPDGTLESDAEWDVAYADLLRASFPGGHLGLLPEDRGEFGADELERLLVDVTGALRTRVPEWLSGSAVARSLGEFGEDDEAEHRIALDVDLEVDADLAELLQLWSESLVENDRSIARACVESATLTTELAGAGELSWSQAARRLDRYTSQGEHETSFQFVLELDFGAGRDVMRIEARLVFHGTWGSEVRVE